MMLKLSEFILHLIMIGDDDDELPVKPVLWLVLTLLLESCDYLA